MSVHLDHQYFDWLYGQVCWIKVDDQTQSFKNLLHILYTKEFIWLVPNDDNRVEDGKELRYEFLEEYDIMLEDRDIPWLRLGCSFLEMLVALCRRLEFETNDMSNVWFFRLLDNIGLSQFNDTEEFTIDEIDDVLDRVIWRTYNYNGGGGLFPLVYPEEDQRKVEIWYQLNAYILEND